MSLATLHRNIRRFTLPVVVCLIALALVGCGYDGKEPPYDCDRNPGNFPEVAVDFLRGIEGGYLHTADEITQRFAAIYTAHPSLLGNKTWREITQRLGLRLQYRADRLVEDGLLQYAQAADYYAIAAQTRPTDSLLATRALLFATWRAAAADSTLDIPRLAVHEDLTPEIITFKIAALARFALGSDTHFQFARQYLAGALFPADLVDHFRTGDAAASLSPPDCALLAALGLMPAEIDTTVVRFRQPDIEVSAVRVARTAPDSFRIEIYFLPRQPIPVDLGISLWIETPDPVLPPDKQPRFPFDFVPTRPTSSWAEGEVAVALRHISFGFPVSAVLLGLYDTTSGHPVYLPIDGSRGDRIRIPIPLDSLRQ